MKKMKANKIYLERLRKDDFVDRSPTNRTFLNYIPKNTTIKPTEISKLLRERFEIMEHNCRAVVIEKPQPKLPKGGVEFVSEMNKLKLHNVEYGSYKKL